MKSLVFLYCCIISSIFSLQEVAAVDNNDLQATMKSLTSKVHELETDLHLMRKTSAVQQETVSALQKVVRQQEEAILDLHKENLYIKQRQHLTGEVAFTAFDDSGNTYYSAGQTVLFRNVFLNEGGNYNTATSQYTCAVNGIYLFSTHTLCAGGAVCDACIVIGDTDTAGYHVNVSDDTGKMGSALLIAYCAGGQTVWVKSKGATVVGRLSENWTSGFSGVLLAYTT